LEPLVRTGKALGGVVVVVDGDGKKRMMRTHPPGPKDRIPKAEGN
jgi:hypothetical protein